MIRSCRISPPQNINPGIVPNMLILGGNRPQRCISALILRPTQQDRLTKLRHLALTTTSALPGFRRISSTQTVSLSAPHLGDCTPSTHPHTCTRVTRHGLPSIFPGPNILLTKSENFTLYPTKRCTQRNPETLPTAPMKHLEAGIPNNVF